MPARATAWARRGGCAEGALSGAHLVEHHLREDLVQHRLLASPARRDLPHGGEEGRGGGEVSGERGGKRVEQWRGGEREERERERQRLGESAAEPGKAEEVGKASGSGEERRGGQRGGRGASVTVLFGGCKRRWRSRRATSAKRRCASGRASMKPELSGRCDVVDLPITARSRSFALPIGGATSVAKAASRGSEAALGYGSPVQMMSVSTESMS